LRRRNRRRQYTTEDQGVIKNGNTFEKTRRKQDATGDQDVYKQKLKFSEKTETNTFINETQLEIYGLS